MAERLTKKISKTIQDKYSLGSYLYYDFAEIDDTNKLLNKLGKLEDILEKYGIESVEELDKKLADGITWKRACELACVKLIPYRINMVGGLFTDEELKEKVTYFYQQAKKEGENEKGR